MGKSAWSAANAKTTTVLAVLQLPVRLSESLPAIDNLFYISLGGMSSC